MKLRALIFDDDPLVCSLLELILENRGYEVVAFQDPSQCPSYTSPACQCPSGQTCTDVIISDVQMPNVRGLDFVEAQVKKSCKCQTTKCGGHPQ